MTSLHLAKLQATGNDFLVRLALDDATLPLAPETVARLCDRHLGIGADGLITIGPGDAGPGVDCTMRLQNADGSDAEMSGNGIRCLAWVTARAGLGTERELVVDTAAGRRVVSLTRDGSGTVVAADVDMGAVTLGDEDIEITIDGVEYWGDVANVGNPHLVCFVIDPAQVPVALHGPRIELDARFPQRTNVEFVRVFPPDRIDLRVWERGAGETLSCGTGACAAVAVARNRGVVDDHVRVHVPGGELDVRLGETARLGGPVEHVFDVDVEIAADRSVKQIS
ncbi:MAG TPA: diaminopimelate epimerase [Acidimicrobiia bacterium]|nr:diaminopimelate epimerase [Acidimicrobiia bacterium]